MAKDLEKEVKEEAENREDKTVGRRFFSTSEGFVDDDGYWKIVTNVGESRTEDGEHWETLYVDSMAIDRDFSNGYQTSITSALSELYEKTIKRGFDSLFDAENYDQKVREKLEEKNAAQDKGN